MLSRAVTVSGWSGSLERILLIAAGLWEIRNLVAGNDDRAGMSRHSNATQVRSVGLVVSLNQTPIDDRRIFCAPGIYVDQESVERVDSHAAAIESNSRTA